MYTDYNDENNNDYSIENQTPNKEKIKKIVFIVLVFVVLVVLIVVIAKGCSNTKKNSTSYNNDNVQPSITINRPSLSLEVDEGFQLRADVFNAKSDNPVVSWVPTNSSIVVVDDLGYVTAVKEGITDVIALYRENDKIYTSKCSIVVASKEIEVQSISIIQDDITLKKGKSILLQVDIKPEDAKIEEGNLLFFSDDPSVATVSGEGYVNAINKGITTIRVKTQDGKFSDSISVTVTDTGTTVINPTSLNIKGITNGLTVGSTTKIIYEITPSNVTNTKLTWTSSDPSIATVNQEGVVTGIKAGKCKIMASTSNNISATIEITVESNKVPVTGIIIDGENSITLKTGGTRMLFYTITPSNATNQDVIYTTSNSNIVQVNSQGIMSALSSGNAVVTITTEDGKKQAFINITVKGEDDGEEPGSTGSNSGDSNNLGSNNSGSNSSSSGSSSSSSSSSSDNACNSYDMITIKHSESGNGPTISTYSYNIAKPFQSGAKPKVTITQYADCLKTALYYIDYGKTLSNMSTASVATGNLSKVGNSFYLNKGDGYYRIRIKATTESGQTLNKTYYAVIGSNASSIDTIKPSVVVYGEVFSSTTSTNTPIKKLKISTTVTENGSGIKNIKYCTSTSSTATTCSFNQTLFSYTDNYPTGTLLQLTKNVTYLSSYKRVCVKVIDEAGNESDIKCANIK